LRQQALTGFQIKTVTVVVTTQFGSVNQLSGGLQVSLFMRALLRERKVLSLDERQQHLTSAEVDFFHDTRR
jgi:ABC-type branched-subunit amino acid transport system ATPase component